MNFFGWTNKRYQIESMTVGCKISDAYVQCTVGDVSRSDLTCSVPTCRIQDCLMDMLNTTLSLRVDNVIMEGTLTWYTIEESTYRLGISIAGKDRPAWRKALTEKNRSVMHASARPASA